jgi:hypothetical protein
MQKRIRPDERVKLRRDWTDNHGRTLTAGQILLVIDLNPYGDIACVCTFDAEGECVAIFTIDTVYLEPMEGAA